MLCDFRQALKCHLIHRSSFMHNTCGIIISQFCSLSIFFIKSTPNQPVSSVMSIVYLKDHARIVEILWGLTWLHLTFSVRCSVVVSPSVVYAAYLAACEWMRTDVGGEAHVCCHISGFLNWAVSSLEADENRCMVGNKLLCESLKSRTWEGRLIAWWCLMLMNTWHKSFLVVVALQSGNRTHNTTQILSPHSCFKVAKNLSQPEPCRFKRQICWSTLLYTV